MTDPWATAQAAQNTGTASTPMTDGASSLADSYADQPSSLFAAGGEGAGPSLLNKTHVVGTERSGILKRAPYNKQSTTMKGELKYWSKKRGEKPVTEPIGPDGTPNRKCEDLVIALDTDYVMDAQEAAMLNREEPYEGGARSVIVGVGSEDEKKIKAAIGDAVSRGIQITGDKDLIGLRLTVKRTGTLPNPHGGDPIKVHEYRFDRA